jgi:hypothetical protein
MLLVSRETVRGAIQRLAGEGVVQVSHGSRTRVTKRSSDIGVGAIGSNDPNAINGYSLKSVSEARQLVETSLVSATMRLTPDDIKRLEYSLEAQTLAVRSRSAPRRRCWVSTSPVSATIDRSSVVGKAFRFSSSKLIAISIRRRERAKSRARGAHLTPRPALSTTRAGLDRAGSISYACWAARPLPSRSPARRTSTAASGTCGRRCISQLAIGFALAGRCLSLSLSAPTFARLEVLR